MAASVSITVSGTVTGLPEGSNAISFTYTSADSPALRHTIDLTTTLVDVATELTGAIIPANARFLLIVPPSSNVNTLEIAGANASGATLHPTSPTLIPLPTSLQSVFLGTAAGTTNNVQLYFI